MFGLLAILFGLAALLMFVPLALVLLDAVLEAMPLAIALLLCLWALHACC